MVYKNGELLRTYYYELEDLDADSLVRFSEMLDKNGLAPDQLGDLNYDFKELSIHFDTTPQQNCTVDIVKMAAPGNPATAPGLDPWDMRELLHAIGANDFAQIDNVHLYSYIDTSIQPAGAQTNGNRKEDWFFDIDNHNGGACYLVLVVRVH